MVDDDSRQELFRAVVFRALCDCLGFTNLSKKTAEHAEAVSEARDWFYREYEDFYTICDCANLDPNTVRDTAKKLIKAKQSGDHTGLPEFWRKALARGRMPSYAAYCDEIDTLISR